MFGYCVQYTLALVNVGKDEIVSIFKHIIRSMCSYLQRFHINHLVLDNVGNKNVTCVVNAFSQLKTFQKVHRLLFERHTAKGKYIF